MTSLQLRIDWAELDLFGHVNNIMFLKYVQASRVHYWEQIGIYPQFLESKQGPMVASVNCQFRLPLHYPGTVTVNTSAQWIKNTSFSLKHTIYNDKGEVAAEAEDILVMFDFNKNEKMPVSQVTRDQISNQEGKIFD